MTSDEITEQLIEFRKKQLLLAQSWKKTGNKDLLQFITEILPASLKAERCGVFLVNPEDNNVWIVSGTYLAERALLASLDGSIAGKVIKSGEVTVATDMEEKVGEHNITGVKTGFVTRNILCIPVFNSTRETVIGAIQLLNKQGGEFESRDYEALEELAGLVRDSLEAIYERQKLVSILEEVEHHIKRLEGFMMTEKRKEQAGE